MDSRLHTYTWGIISILNSEKFGHPKNCCCYPKLSLVMRKAVFGVCDQIRHKPACAATEAKWRLEILDIKTRDIILSRQRTTKALIRLHGLNGRIWHNRFSPDVAQIWTVYFYYRVIHPKDANKMTNTNSVDPHQTAPQAVWSGYTLVWHTCQSE